MLQIRKLKRWLLVPLCLLTPVLLLLGQALFGGKSLVPADILFLFPVWKADYPAAAVRNSLLSDNIFSFYSWHALIHSTITQQGYLPLWNPFEFAGNTLIGNIQSTFFYPPNLLLAVFDAGRVATFRAAFILLIAGIFTYLLCRELGIGTPGSLLSALAFMLSGPIITWLGNSPANVISLFPLQLWAAEKLIRRRTGFPWWIVLGISMALTVVGGHPETTLHSNIFLGIYILVRIVMIPQARRKAGRVILECCLAAGVGVLLSAIQWLPFLELTLRSSTLSTGGRGLGGGLQVYSGDWLYNAVTLVTLLIPQFFGSPALGNYTWPFPVFQNYTEQSYYFGLIPFAFSVYSLLKRPKKGWAIFYAVFGLLCLAVALRLPGFEIVNYVPPFSLMSNKRLRIYFTFFFAILAGLGLEDWLDARDTGKRDISRLIPGIVFIGALSVTGFMFILGRFHAFAQAHNIAVPEFLFRLSDTVFNLNRPTTFFPAIVALIGLALLALAWTGKSPMNINGARVGLVVCAALDLLVAGWNYNPAMDNPLIFPQTKVLQQLSQEQQPFRVVGNYVLPENTGTVFQIPQVEGYDMPVYQPVSAMYYGQGGKGADYHQRWKPDWPLIDWFNVKYFFSAKPIEMDKYRLVFQNEYYYLYENTQALPRAFMVNQYEVIPDADQALRAILSPSFDFKNKVILAEPPGDANEIAAASGGTAQYSPVVFTEYSPDRVRMKVQESAPGLLLMSDIYYPGWKATVDGKETPIIKANYAFRAVSVPAGTHQVEFLYQPASFEIGKWLSILGVLVCLGGLLYWRFIR